MNLFKGSLIASLLCLSPLCYAQIDDIDAKTKAKIESIIDEYVSTHPEIIIRAMQKLEHDEQAVQANNVKNAGIALRNDSTLPQINTSRAKHYIVEFFDFNCVKLRDCTTQSVICTDKEFYIIMFVQFISRHNKFIYIRNTFV